MKRFLTKEQMLKKVTLPDTAELRKLILENPDLPIVIMVSSADASDEVNYIAAQNNSVTIEDLVMVEDCYGDCVYTDKEEATELLTNDPGFIEEHADITDEEYFEKVAEEVDKADSVKAIVIYASC